MMKPHRSLVLGLAVLLVGCSDSTTDPSAKTPTAKDVQEQVGKAADTAGEYASDQVRQYADTLNDKLQEFDTQLQSLQQQGEQLAGEAQKQWQQQMQNLQQKRQQVAGDLQRLKDASGDAWLDVKSGLDDAWQDLQGAASKAAERFK
jgi:TolA-binding protein